MNKLTLSLADIKTQISHLEFFQQLPEQAFNALCSEIELFGVEGGEYLFRKNDLGDCMYVVANGRLRVVDEPVNGEVLVEFGAGQPFGEIALISEQPRMASVQACRDSQVLRLSKDRYHRIISQWPEVLLKNVQLLLEQIKKAGTVTKKKAVIKTITLVPVCDTGIFSEFSQKLTEQLKKEGQILYLSSKSLNQSDISKSSASWDIQNLPPSFVRAINGKESQYRFIIFEADATLTSWTEFCLRQADRILLACSADESPDLNEIESFIFKPSDFEPIAAIELYLLHRSEQEGNQPVAAGQTREDLTEPEHPFKRIKGTKRWLEKRPVFRHHHLLLDHIPHYERAARFLSGKAVGLVIGGGGARGGGALGVIRALREKNIPIDMVGGNSIGSIVSGLSNMGYTVETILKKLMTMADGINPFSMLNLPVFSLITKKVADKMYSNLFGEQTMEDLWTNGFAVATNLSTGGTMVYRSGLLREVCRASSSLPGIFEPVIQDGNIIVDGGLVDNLPIDVMSDLCQGYIILINILPEEGFVLKGQSLPSPFKFIASRLNPFSKPVKSLTIVDFIARTFSISNYHDLKEAESLADLNFKPPIQDSGYFDLKVYGETMKIGYDYAKEKLKDFTWD